VTIFQVLLSAIARANVMDLGPQWGPEMQLRNFLLLLSIYQIPYPMIQWTVARRLLTVTVPGAVANGTIL